MPTDVSGQIEGSRATKKNPLPVQVSFYDSPVLDAFNRLRVSNPETIFDSKNIFNNPDLANDVENQPLFYDNQQTSGTGTSTAYHPNQSQQSLTVSADTAGTRVRQTFQRFNYQPGKSILVLMTFALGSQDSGIIKREGLFDEKNGLFLEDNGSEYRLVTRTYTTGTAVDNGVSQSDWNLDPMDGTGLSGITLDFSKTQILVFDYEWLGVGRVRMGFVVNGLIYYAHEFLNANNLEVVYMSTPNLPLRSEISNDGNGPESTLTQICSTVISEGGQNPLGVVRSVSTSGTNLDANATGTKYALLGLRIKSNYIGEVINLISTAIQVQTGDHKLIWELYLNPTVAGTVTYTGLSNSAIEYFAGVTANTVTGGTLISSGFAESGGRQQGDVGSTASDLRNSINLGSTINGTSDYYVLSVMPIDGSTNVDVEGSITWRELN